MSLQEFRKIFQKIQMTSACHQKHIIILTDLYKRTLHQEFLQPLLRFLQSVVSQTSENSVYTKRALCFISRFCATITKKEEKENETHELLAAVFEKILQWSCFTVYDVRYNSCFFISLVLQDIGEEVQLELNLIDEIQSVLLERMQETKIPIRLAAMSGLVRLQDPQNFDCPVINAYMQALLSGSALIRKDAIERIAPNMITLNKIRDRVRDSDPGVRSAAFHKCADIGPLNFRIADKHLILLCGFKETEEKVKNTFHEYLLSKWLTAYNGDYLKFVGALKLIADEDDIDKMTYLVKELVKEFYNKHSTDDLIAVLPINDDKIINVEQLTNEVTLFWNILSNLLRESGDTDVYLNKVLPELTAFCHYIESVIKVKSVEKMDEWKVFEYQFDLLNFFEIGENYDFSDEVGRRTMQSLTITILQNNNFTSKLTKKLVSIAQQCSSNIEFFTNDMCQVISEIREPLMDEPLTQDQRMERDFKAAQLRVKINVQTEQQSEAIAERDYRKAQQIDEELMILKKQLEILQSQLSTEKVRVTKSDNQTLCRCLDILASVLELPSVSKLTPSLITCRDQFLISLITNPEVEIHWRVLKCLTLCALIDKATAEEYAKVVCIPLATYRTVPTNNVSALMVSISGVTDLISLYGIEIVGEGEEVANASAEQNMKRKLYTTESEEQARLDNMTLSYILEIFLDMLDDEREEIRHKAILAISSLILRPFPVTPTLLSRILLKWYSPLTEKQDGKLEVYLGLLIDQYMRFKSSGEVLKEAFIPTLNSIVRAPRTSPLIDIDIDNVLMFFSEALNINLSKDELRIFALDICMKISEKSDDRIVPFLTKFLSHLDIRQTDDASMNELVERAEMLLENLPDKMPKKYAEKFVTKLKLKQSSQAQKENTIKQTNETANRSEAKENENEESVRVLQETTSDNERNVMKEPQQVKRRKKRNVEDCIVVLERLNISSCNQHESNETKLHTILETSMEMDNLRIDTPESSKDSEMSTKRNSIVISETSDSDLSNDQPRRSSRRRKKRIL